MVINTFYLSRFFFERFSTKLLIKYCRYKYPCGWLMLRSTHIVTAFPFLSLRSAHLNTPLSNNVGQRDGSQQVASSLSWCDKLVGKSELPNYFDEAVRSRMN